MEKLRIAYQDIEDELVEKRVALEEEEEEGQQEEQPNKVLLARCCEIPPDFDINQSVLRLHEGKSNRTKEFTYDNVPNLVFIRENPYVRERLFQKGELKKSIERLYEGRMGTFERDLIMH